MSQSDIDRSPSVLGLKIACYSTAALGLWCRKNSPQENARDEVNIHTRGNTVFENFLKVCVTNINAFLANNRANLTCTYKETQFLISKTCINLQ